MPALTRFYGITPMDIEHMSLREVSEYVAAYDRYVAEQERQEREANRGQ